MEVIIDGVRYVPAEIQFEEGDLVYVLDTCPTEWLRGTTRRVTMSVLRGMAVETIDINSGFPHGFYVVGDTEVWPNIKHLRKVGG